MADSDFKNFPALGERLAVSERPSSFHSSSPRLSFSLSLSPSHGLLARGRDPMHDCSVLEVLPGFNLIILSKQQRPRHRLLTKALPLPSAPG